MTPIDRKMLYSRGARGDEAPGVLAGNATALSIDKRLAALVAAPVPAANGLLLLDLGVSITRSISIIVSISISISISFDAERLAALPPARQADAEALLQTLSLKANVAVATPAAAGLSHRREAVAVELAKIDVRLLEYGNNLTRQYAAMERLVAASNAAGA